MATITANNLGPSSWRADECAELRVSPLDAWRKRIMWKFEEAVRHAMLDRFGHIPSNEMIAKHAARLISRDGSEIVMWDNAELLHWRWYPAF